VARSPVYEKGNIWISFAKAVFYPVTAILGRRRFQGLENITVSGPILMVGNHISQLDPVYDAVFVRKAGRWPRFMAKASLWKVPVARNVLVGTRQIPVERNAGAGRAILDHAIGALDDGAVVLIYPEGTTTKDPEYWPMKPRAGVAILALSGDYPVIPFVNWGTHQVLDTREGKVRFRPFPRRDIVVRAGTPIDLSAYRGKELDARTLLAVTNVIMNAVRDLLAEVRQETPPKRFFDPKKLEKKQAQQVEKAAADSAAGPSAEAAAGEAAATVAPASPADTILTPETPKSGDVSGEGTSS